MFLFFNSLSGVGGVQLVHSARRPLIGLLLPSPGWLWWRIWFDPGSDQVGFVVDKVALEQVFSEYFGFPCQSSFHQFLHNHSHLSSGAGTIGQKWPQYKGLSLTPLEIKKILDCRNMEYKSKHDVVYKIERVDCFRSIISIYVYIFRGFITTWQLRLWRKHRSYLTSFRIPHRLTALLSH
jgi:hypothetical protein